VLLNAVRYGIPAAFLIAGVILLAFGGSSNRWDGLAMCVGAGLSVALLNLFFRIGASGDEERDAEEAAREYLAKHGHWPDEAPRRQRQR
jgi:drug/metabolite transporter (DMT)-like permease